MAVFDIFFDEVGKYLDKFYQIYDKFLCIGDFNVEESEPVLPQFLNNYNAVNIIHVKTSYKSIDVCFNGFVTSTTNSFQNKSIFRTGLSNFRKLVLNTYFGKQHLKNFITEIIINLILMTLKLSLNKILLPTVAIRKTGTGILNIIR